MIGGVLAAGLSMVSIAAAAPSAMGRPAPSAGEPSDDEPAGNAYAKPRLIAEAASVRPGQTVMVAVTFEIAPEWYMYWPGQNDSGVPTTLEWTLPAGVKVGEVRWPAPERKVLDGDLLDYVFHKRLTLAAPITVPTDAKGTVKIECEAEWLVCKDACLPGKARLTLELPVAETGTSPPSGDAPLVSDARAAWAAPMPASGEALAYEVKGDTLNIRVPGARVLVFCPHERGARLVDALHSGQRKGEELSLAFEPPAAGKNAPGQQGPGQELRIAGVLLVTRADGKVQAFDVNLPMAEVNGR